MSKLIENIKRLAAMVKGETKSGANTAARVGGLFEEIADELELKYDRVDSDRMMREHDTAGGAHQNIQDAIEERIAGVDKDLTDVNRDLSKAIADGDNQLADTLGEQSANLSKAIADGDRALSDVLVQTNAGLSKAITDGDNGLSDAITQTNANLSKKLDRTDTNLKAHKDDVTIHQTSAQIRADIVDADIPAALARLTEVNTKDAATLAAAKQHVAEKIAEVLNGSPAALDTLFELAAALNNDPNFATTVMNAIGQKENAFSKNTAFNKNFGASADTICQGNDARLSNARPASGGDADTIDGRHADAFQPAGDYAAGNHNHAKSQITDFPVSMPASDVYAWAKQAGKPVYLADEITETVARIFFTQSERDKLASVGTNNIRRINSFSEATEPGDYAIPANAPGGPAECQGNQEFWHVGFLRVREYGIQPTFLSETPTATPIGGDYLLYRELVCQGCGTEYYFISYTGYSSGPWRKIFPDVGQREIQTGTFGSYNNYTSTGKYAIVCNTADSPDWNSPGFAVLLEVEEMPSGSIWQTARDAYKQLASPVGETTISRESVYIYTRCFYKDSGGFGKWTAWNRIYPSSSTSTVTPESPTTTPPTVAPEGPTTTPPVVIPEPTTTQ